MTALRLALLLPLLAACGPRQPSTPYVRITTPDGRIYYADQRISLHSASGGFLQFRDAVTNEKVRLKNNTYKALLCPVSEVRVRQREYMADPTKVPHWEGEEPR